MTPEQLSNEESEYTWTFRGYRLDPSSFTTAMVHFYRAEMARSNTWRTRLDATTNWAVAATGAALTFAFGAPENPHYVIILVLLLVLTFLGIEARRYRYYLLWSYRVHLLETDFFAAMLAPPFHPSSDWADHLAESLLQPAFPIAQWEAVGRRFRRNYVWLVTLLFISWGAKLALHPALAASWATLVGRAAIGPLPGVVMMAAAGAMYGILATLAVAASCPAAWRQALRRPLQRAPWPLMLTPRPQERLATIITNQGQEVAAQLLAELGRGVTALKGTGMYTNETRDVLLCAVTDVQLPHLEEIVRRTAPGSFVVISSAEVHGKGFRPFEAPS